MLEISKNSFPDGDKPYPSGSYYKADGDAVYYIISNPSVALRCAIEFMRVWYEEVTLGFPECRTIIEQGNISEIKVPGKTELVGKAFEYISIFEKDLGDGQIYVTQHIIENLDQTMANFILFREYDIESGQKLQVYKVNYLDPRTIGDSSLIHALFVSNPHAEEARNRVIELFLIEFLLENKVLVNLEDIAVWGKSKGYSLPPQNQLEAILNKSSLISCKEHNKINKYSLDENKKVWVENQRTEFFKNREICINNVIKEIQTVTSSVQSTQHISMGSVIEEYLSAVFSEIRFMANYFKHNHELFQENKARFAKFDYILKRALPNLGSDIFDDWKGGFLQGLKNEAKNDNPFIASIFHNVLATYYLNRSTETSHYQLSKLKEREFYFDTNVLYAYLVNASNYHSIIKYIVEKINNIGMNPKVFPFTLNEYENSIRSVEKQCPGGKPSFRLRDKNPGLLQEFIQNSGRYQESMSICRIMHSISEDIPVNKDNYYKIDSKLKNWGLKLEPTYTKYQKKQVDELWIGFRNLMPSDWWDLDKYWDFINLDSRRPLSVISHDVHCLQNLIDKVRNQSKDELGLKTFFVSLDSNKILRIRKEYPFIISPEQFLEFFLPYLFLADIPLIEAKSFPNRLLSAGLSTLLVKRPPKAVEMLQAFLEDPSLLDRPNKILSKEGKKIAKALNSERFRKITQESPNLTGDERREIAEEIDKMLKKEFSQSRGVYYGDHKKLLGQVDDQQQQIKKLNKTIKYWKSQARKKKK